ncbi:MAG TPA: hypothetical protein VJ961_07030 [Mariprofundaceae bacterium]|nr:hypothetical protein [Mariprofundaceae bacterium]
MGKRFFRVAIIAFTTAFMAGAVTAQAEEKAYGWQLMSPQEKMEYRERMRSVNAQQRADFRKQHHEQMQERARQRGVTLPDEPGSGRGMHRGQGMDQGKGMGRRRGMGQGRGRGMGR